MLNDAEGEALQPGEAGSYFITIFKNDSLLRKVREYEPEPQRFLLPSEEELAEQTEPNPLIDALRLMSVGDSLSVLIPMDTIERRPDGFEADDVLRYDLVLASTTDRTTYEAEEAARRAAFESRIAAYGARESIVADSIASVLAEYKRGAARAGFTETSSGLMYKILEPGTGPAPELGKPVLVSYYGVTTRDGVMFDNSFRAKRPIDFPLGVGRVITGWDEGIALLREGARAVLAIPSDLAYGDNPQPGSTIQAGDELMFYVQLEEVAR